MKLAKPFLWQFLGVILNGDIGPYTTYTSQRKRFVIFLKTWPKDPPTYHQTIHRNRWKHAGYRWQNLPEATKEKWRQLSRKANCTVTGYNLFIYYMVYPRPAIIETLQRQTGINVIADTGPPIPMRLGA